METGGSRWKKKLVGKTSWYKQRKRNSDEETQRQVGGKDRKRGKMDHHEKLKTRAVLFVPQTPLGELARRIREDLQRMENLTKFRLKVVERAGTSLQNLLSQTSIWRGIPCGREECVPCCQGGEEIPPCTRTSVVYENICVTCNPEATRRGDMETPATDQPSLYVGESSRSLQERIKEHWGSYKRKEEGSHIRKHQDLQHPGEEPNFLVKAVSFHRTALGRQIREAVRIRRRGGEGRILNSKAEFNRSYIPRLVVDKQGEEEVKASLEQERQEVRNLLDKEEGEWQVSKMRSRESRDKKRRLHSNQDQRSWTQDMEEDQGWGGRRKKRKLLFSTIGENWGGEDDLGQGKEDDRWKKIDVGDKLVKKRGGQEALVDHGLGPPEAVDPGREVTIHQQPGGKIMHSRVVRDGTPDVEASSDPEEGTEEDILTLRSTRSQGLQREIYGSVGTISFGDGEAAVKGDRVTLVGDEGTETGPETDDASLDRHTGEDPDQELGREVMPSVDEKPKLRDTGIDKADICNHSTTQDVRDADDQPDYTEKGLRRSSVSHRVPQEQSPRPGGRGMEGDLGPGHHHS